MEAAARAGPTARHVLFKLDDSYSACSDHETWSSHETVSCFMRQSHETSHISMRSLFREYFPKSAATTSWFPGTREKVALTCCLET